MPRFGTKTGNVFFIKKLNSDQVRSMYLILPFMYSDLLFTAFYYNYNLLHCAVDLCKNPAPLKLVGISTKLQLDLVIFVSLLSKKCQIQRSKSTHTRPKQRHCNKVSYSITWQDQYITSNNQAYAKKLNKLRFLSVFVLQELKSCFH